MKLHEQAPKVNRKTRKRRGQGNGTGNGTFGGRGCKGQNCRAGGGVRHGFEGGQTPLIQRMPKFRGFKNPCRVEAQILNLSDLETHFQDGDKIDFNILVERNIVKKTNPKVKILGNGEITKKIEITESILISKSAKKAIEKAGGKVLEKKV